MNRPPSNPSQPAERPAANDTALPASADEALWQTLELEMAREQLKVLRESISLARERIELLTAELRMLPWNHARLIRDARLAVVCSRSSLAEARQAADEARSELQRASDELTLAEEQLAAARADRRSRGLGLLMRRRRHNDSALLDLRMSQALANERLRAATERVQQDRLVVAAQEQTLSDLLSRRRRQRSILLEEIETLERQLRRERVQCRDYAQIVAECEATDHAVLEDSMAPA